MSVTTSSIDMGLLRPRERQGRRSCPRRRGATVIETAIVIMVFLTLVLGMLDLGIAVFRHHLLSHAARHLARQAVVHGSMADRLGDWGTTTFTGTAADASPIVSDFADGSRLSDYLPGIDPATVTVTVQWPTGGNDTRMNDVVRTTLSTPYQPIMTFIFGGITIDLSASSQMHVAH
jgi:Flp pilus assembly protein TadG